VTGFTATVEAGDLNVNQTTVGANKIAEYMLVGFVSDEPYELRSQAIPTTHFRVRAFVGPYGPANPTATTFAGIEIGGFGTTTPFSATPTGCVAQLRIRGDTDAVELVSAVGDGTAVAIQSFNIGTIKPHGLVLELDYDWPNRKIKAYADGQLLGVATNFADLAAFPPADSNHFSLFCTGGSNAAAAQQVWFSLPQLMIFNGRGGSQ